MGNGRASREWVHGGDCAVRAAKGSWQSRDDTFISHEDFASRTGRIPHSQNREIGFSWRGEFPRPALPPRRARHCGAGDFSLDPADDARGDAVQFADVFEGVAAARDAPESDRKSLAVAVALSGHRPAGAGVFAAFFAAAKRDDAPNGESRETHRRPRGYEREYAAGGFGGAGSGEGGGNRAGGEAGG